MLCVGCILHDKGAPGGGVGVKGGDWYLAIVGCCRAAGAGDYDSSCLPGPRTETATSSPAVLLLKKSQVNEKKKKRVATEDL